MYYRTLTMNSEMVQGSPVEKQGPLKASRRSKPPVPTTMPCGIRGACKHPYRKRPQCARIIRISSVGWISLPCEYTWPFFNIHSNNRTHARRSCKCYHTGKKLHFTPSFSHLVPKHTYSTLLSKVSPGTRSGISSSSSSFLSSSPSFFCMLW